MMGGLLSACSLAVVLALPGSAGAGEVHLTIQNGRVALSARDVTLRQVLLEWERVGDTRVVIREGVPDTPLTLELVDVPEEQALRTLLRSTPGYVAAKRLERTSGGSMYRLIILIAATASRVAPSQTAQGAEQLSAPVPLTGQGQQRIDRQIMPDGRVIALQENPGRPSEMLAVTDDEPPLQSLPGNFPVMVFAPGQMPQSSLQGQGSADLLTPDLQRGQGPGSQIPPTTRTAPTAVKSAPRPGMVIPEPPTPYVPGGGAPPPLPPQPPIKPPGV
ncbi:MAG: hypothetical protein NTV05_18245 [Acidobacteria bacterium]|nr:hypothetical protein [Acidobacteriota bacterium]